MNPNPVVEYFDVFKYTTHGMFPCLISFSMHILFLQERHKRLRTGLFPTIALCRTYWEWHESHPEPHVREKLGPAVTLYWGYF